MIITTNHLNKLLEVEGILLEDVHRARKSNQRDRKIQSVESESSVK